MAKARPTFFLLAGPNGAGKSTLYETVIKPKIKAPFINADLIQKQELDDQSMQGAYEAAKVAEQRRQTYLQRKQSFVSESTFSHPSKLKLIDTAKAAGFRVVLYHVSVGNVELSVARVATRVEKGGHNVPEQKIRERYERNQELIRAAILKSEKGFIYDNSALRKPPFLLIEFTCGRIVTTSRNISLWACNLYEKQLKKF